MKTFKATPPVVSNKGKGELLRRLDPRAVEILEVFSTIKGGEAFDVKGEMRSVSRIAGAMMARWARETGKEKKSIKCVDQKKGVVRVFVI